MAKQIRYIGRFQSVSGQSIKFDILQETGSWYTPDYVPVELAVDGDAPISIDWEEATPETVFNSSSLTLKLISENNFEFLDLSTVDYTDVRINVYVDDALYWSGNLDAESYSEPFESLDNYVVTLTFDDFGQLKRESAVFKPSVTPASVLFKHLLDLDFPYSMLAEILSGAVNHTSTLVTKTENETLPTPLNAFQHLVFDLTTLGAEATAYDSIEAMFKPLNWHIIQKSGHFYVFDVNGLVGSSSGDVDIEWSTDAQTLDFPPIYTEIRVTFSPSTDLQMSGEANYDGGIYDTDLHPVVRQDDAFDYYPYAVADGSIVFPFAGSYSYKALLSVGGDPYQFTPGSTNSVTAYPYSKDSFIVTRSPYMDRCKAATRGFLLYASSDVVDGCPISLMDDYAKVFKTFSYSKGIGDVEGIMCYAKTHLCVDDLNMVVSIWPEVLKHYPIMYPSTRYGSTQFTTHANARARQAALSDVIFKYGSFHVQAGDAKTYLNIKLPLLLSGSLNPALDAKEENVQIHLDDPFNVVHLEKDSNGNKIKAMGVTPSGVFSPKEISNLFNEVAKFVYVPVVIKCVTDNGHTLYYSNRLVRDSSADYYSFNDTVNNLWWTETPSVCYMAYYHAELANRLEGSPLNGSDFVVNNQTINASFTVLKSDLLDNVEGQSISFPYYGGQFVSGTISIEVLGTCWEIGYVASFKETFERVDTSFFTLPNEEYNYVKGLNALSTLCLFKQPEISIKADTDKSYLLDSVDSNDIVYSATLESKFKETFDIDVAFGTKTDKIPYCNNLLSLDDDFHSKVTEFSRNGITGTAEALLCSTLYSQYASRKVKLSGQAYTDGTVSTYATFVDSVVKSSPHFDGKKFMLVSSSEDLSLDSAESVFQESAEDTYVPIDLDVTE